MCETNCPGTALNGQDKGYLSLSLSFFLYTLSFCEYGGPISASYLCIFSCHIIIPSLLLLFISETLYYISWINVRPKENSFLWKIVSVWWVHYFICTIFKMNEIDLCVLLVGWPCCWPCIAFPPSLFTSNSICFLIERERGRKNRFLGLKLAPKNRYTKERD